MVLLVDDNEYLTNSIKDLLNIHKITAHACNNPEAALKLCSENEFEVIVTDIHMPQQNGIEFISNLEKKDVKAEIIVFSGHIKKEELLQVVEFERVFAVFQKSDLVEKLVHGVKKAKQFHSLV
jgi:DNA-binding NarL/FixJ family response regulator